MLSGTTREQGQFAWSHPEKVTVINVSEVSSCSVFEDNEVTTGMQ